MARAPPKKNTTKTETPKVGLKSKHLHIFFKWYSESKITPVLHYRITCREDDCSVLSLFSSTFAILITCSKNKNPSFQNVFLLVHVRTYVKKIFFKIILLVTYMIRPYQSFYLLPVCIFVRTYISSTYVETIKRSRVSPRQTKQYNDAGLPRPNKLLVQGYPTTQTR